MGVTNSSQLDGKTVFVTGSDGFIGGKIIKALLEIGCNVHISLFKEEINHNLSLLQAASKDLPGNLKCFDVNPNIIGSYTVPMLGCDYLIHTDIPSSNKEKGPSSNKKLLTKTLRSTESILDSIKKIASIKRVVMTSSIYSMYGYTSDIKFSQKGMISEADWNSSSNIENFPYAYIRTEREKLAWKIEAQQNQWQLITINPSIIVGPVLNLDCNFESKYILTQLASGALRIGAPLMSAGIVSIDDVVDAHLAGLINPEASGRYILSESVQNFLSISETISSEFHGYPLPKSKIPYWLCYFLAPKFDYDRSFIKENSSSYFKINNHKSIHNLKIKYKDTKRAILDLFDQLVTYRHIKLPGKT